MLDPNPLINSILNVMSSQISQHLPPVSNFTTSHCCQDNTPLKENLWELAATPINLDVLEGKIEKYPNTYDKAFILDGFKNGFKLNYTGPRFSIHSSNLLSAQTNAENLNSKLQEDASLGRIIGPFSSSPMSNLRINPVGLVPKNTGGLRLITNLSFPPGFSVNDYIDPQYSHVKYSSFDNAVKMVQTIGKSAFMAKADISSAFNLCPIWPGDFDLLGIKSCEGYWVQKTLPQGASCSCFIFEKFSTFLQWLVSYEANCNNFDHLLDDFFMVNSNYTSCKFLMQSFESVCSALNVPLSEDKWVGPVQIITFLGLEIDAVNQMIRVPRDKVLKAKSALLELVSCSKNKLRQFQSTVGLLNFIAKAIPAGRSFNRRFYDKMAQAKKPHHFIRVTRDMIDDAKVWMRFLDNFNGTCLFNDSEWVEDQYLELYTDSSGNKSLGCGCNLKGFWTVFKWPPHWPEEVFKDITYLELIPIILAFYTWGEFLTNKKIVLRSDNLALVEILNKKSAKNKEVMTLIRHLMLLILEKNIQVKAKHVCGKKNEICDAISRFQWQRLHTVLPSGAQRLPSVIPESFLQIFNLK
ncbi:uncharacterized protein LOC128551371 [Mercenaria mercenaria]|uniref:uncharacterized protein LOC128551371 n=1 Tax=Mercenaria mercenaria TaxID=6596 RepID=UPI00234F1729|nr:uncharacterized protein LOC128551371 [Mercenaria mercenaria]